MAPQDQFLEVSPYVNHHISMDTEGPITPSSVGISYIYVIGDAFSHYVLLHPSQKNDHVSALNVSLNHWIDKFGIPDISVTDNEDEFINSDLTHLVAFTMKSLNQVHRTHHGQTAW